MDSLKNTLTELTEMFHARMSEFEEELQKAPTTPNTTTSLSTEFASFRRFITQAVTSLQQQVEIIAKSVDTLEMRSRRKILLLHGVTEEQKEDTAKVITEVVRNKMKLSDFMETDISRCYRMGRALPNKSRPILFKLRNIAIRDRIWFSKSKLKASGVTASEFLTKGRHDVLLSAREKLGVAKTWTKAGTVFVLGPDGRQIRVESIAELSKITPDVQPNSKPAAGKTTTTTKAKRAAVKK